MKKLIINSKQLQKIEEASVLANEPTEVNTQLNKGNNVQFQQSGKTGNTVNLSADEWENPSSLDSSMKMAKDDANILNISPMSESYSISKKEIRVLSSLNENDSVYSKKSFKKMLAEEYTDFNTRLNNRRKTR